MNLHELLQFHNEWANVLIDENEIKNKKEDEL